MAKLEHFLATIENPRLREQLLRGVRDPAGQTQFGRVYEGHIAGEWAGSAT